jgi:AmmeMemoRadiSam system protein B
MTRDPDPPRPSSRIIVPGADPEPESPAKRIILPPGVSTQEEDDSLPERPRLRPLILIPFSDGKRELLLVNDPLGLIPGQPVLSADSLPLIQLFDGSATLNEITTVLARESKDVRMAGVVRDFVSQLDRLLMLESPRFDKAYRELRDAYHALEFRQAAHEGRSYPADRAALEKSLDEHFATAEAWKREAGEAPTAGNARPRALMAPHLDPRRAGAAIARAYLEIGTALERPLRVVVFGTGHSLFGDSLALTRKHFETPLGKVTCDTAFVDAVAASIGEDAAYRAELTHRDEHSIEFQAVYLKRRLGDRPFTIVPILCGGFHVLLDEEKTPRDDPDFEGMLRAVAETEQRLGGDTLYVAGVDLSHVGPRFGDPPPDDRTRQEVEARDRAALDAALRGDADGWYQSIAEHEDSTRICGWAPMYALLRCANPGAGRLLRHEQSSEPDGSVVSLAAAVWDQTSA